MCRMFGMVATQPTSVRDLLHEAPRSLRVLSEEHADGWGIALRHDDDWLVRRSTACAARCADFANVETSASLVIAHVRKKTVGELALANTHPFRRGSFVFAHNGTLGNIARLEARTAHELLVGVHGTTDSERFFAFVMTHVMGEGDVERGVAAAVRELHEIDPRGSASFLLSCGARLYAHRQNRTLYMARRPGVALVASEPLTAGDRWDEIGEHQVVVIDRDSLAPHAIAS